ncbi:sterol desaturase family protein [Pseudoxanthomonas sacheonensis]|uniref:sterol desaturase family protein n=1 Tax=Pseudoxanthomonas sacheonensis TaxID=443615 RepID=UPI0013D2B687|nr:sterol desaturase family protein [Pseudoxanthomonas sacheonensis]KAF1710112.1 fatty acid hydroxylase [Pseudoxanthomonas sacheonensis]
MDFSRPLLLFPGLLLVLIAAIEGWVLVRRGRDYDWKGYWASLGDVLGRGALNLVVQGGLTGAMLYGIWNLRVATIGMDRWWHWALLFVGQEFCYYWMHRADHRIRWFWLNHSVHHSSNQYNLSAAYRLGWTGKLTGAAIFFGPLVWMGFPVPYVVGALAMNLLYQFWLHTELIGKLPRPIEFLFNTPAHHRVHHASNPDYIDCNYGGVLILFDRLFGTFRDQRADEPPRYGLVEPLRSYNPLRIASHAWVGMFHDLRLARGWRETWLTVFGPPEYKPAAAKKLHISC